MAHWIPPQVLLRIVASSSWFSSFGKAIDFSAKALDGPGLLVIAIADSSFLSIPEANDLLIVILSTGQPWSRMAYYVTMTTIGSLLGCLILYSVGLKGGNLLLRKKFSPERVDLAEKMFNKYGLLAVVVPSLLPPPTPLKVFVLAAGAFRLSWIGFVAAIVVGRTVRYSFWGVLAVLYGESVRHYMENNLRMIGLGLLAVLVTLIVGTAILLYWRRRTHRAE